MAHLEINFNWRAVSIFCAKKNKGYNRDNCNKYLYDNVTLIYERFNSKNCNNHKFLHVYITFFWLSIIFKMYLTKVILFSHFEVYRLLSLKIYHILDVN